MYLEILCKDLPVADSENLGCVKIGDTFTIDDKGVLNIKDLESLIEELDDLYKSVKEGKTLISESLIKRGVETEENSEFSVLANNILKIDSGTLVDNVSLKDYITIVGSNSSLEGVPVFEEMED